MPKNSYQKGSVQISTFAGMAIIAAVVVVLSTIAVIKYRETTSVTQSVAVITPKLTPSIISSIYPIGQTAIFDGGDTQKWHACESLDCISNLMKEENGSPEAINFTKLIYQENSGNLGFLEQFQEMGKVDLGLVVFPDRANTNEAYYLLNGSPLLVSTGISTVEFTKTIERDSLYSEMKNKYPDIGLWTALAKFSKKETLSNNNERFIFSYEFKNGCHACTTEYSASIGFDFDSNGQFFKTTFLQIMKEKINNN